MTWPLASLLLLLAALAVGVAWYERSRPPARVLALVATLAALAALGRIAFAPVPNVKPTTDIVLIAGAALGGPAGFAVGAVAALASNVFFGQGPWTPWQMLAWGLCGILGAVLVRLGGERMAARRVPLAAACGAAGLMFGAILDFGTASLAGGSDLGGRFLAMDLGTSVAWNIAHAVGNVLFALVFGSALFRALARFRRRSQVVWRPAAAPVAAFAVLAVLAASPLALAASSRSYLVRAQNADGGFGAAPRAPSSALYTSWAALGLAAGGLNPQDVTRGGRSPLDSLRTGARRLSSAGDLERTILVLGAAGVSPRSFGGRDLVAALARHRRRDGSFDGQVNLTAFGVFALGITGAPTARVSAAARWLEREQDRDGGWNFFRRGGASDADDTGAVLQALVAAGRGRGRAAARGYGWLARHQDRDGGWGQADGLSNAQSTAWAVQGVIALGRDPGRLHRRGAPSPLIYLARLTRPDGSVRYSRESAQTPVWVTGQVELARRGRTFPLAAVPREGVAAAPRPSPRPAAAARTHPSGQRRRAPARRPHRKKAHRPQAAAPPASPRALRLARSAGVIAGLLLAPVR